MRIKTVSIDGEEFTIGALTLDQVEEMIAPVTELEGKAGIAKVYDIVIKGLNNAITESARRRKVEVNPADLWDEAKVKSSLDLVTLPFVKDQILDFSSLRQEVKANASGEGQVPVVG